MKTYRNVREVNSIRIPYERIPYALGLHYNAEFYCVKKKEFLEIMGGFTYSK
mgnify:CR=1 FL=1